MSDEQRWTAPGPVPPDRVGGDRPAVPPGPPPGPPPSQQAWPPHAAVPPPRLDYRPGVVPLRPLGLSEIWSGVFATVRGNPAATLGLALLTTALALVPTTLVALWLAGQDLGLAELLDPGSVPGGADPFLSATLASYVPTLAMWLTSILLPLFIALVIGHAVQGRKVTLAETWQQSRGRIWTGVRASLLILAIFLGVAVAAVVLVVLFATVDTTAVTVLGITVTVLGFVLAAVFLWVRVGFAVPIVVLEGASARRSLARSWQLTRGRPFWRILGIRLLTTLVASIAGSIVVTPLSFIGLLTLEDPTAGGSAVSWVLPLTQAFAVLIESILITPFVSGVDSLLYLDQRIRREALDVQILQQLHAPRSS